MTTMLAEQPGASTAAPPPAHAVDPETLRHVRAAVHDVLTHTPSWRALPSAVRREVAKDMVTIGTYLVDGERPGDHPAALALDDSERTIPVPPDVSFDPGDTAGGRFRGAGGAQAA